MTHREARKKLGSRKTRRAGTNGKILNTNSKIHAKRRNPLRHKAGPTPAAKVWALVEGRAS